MTVKQLIQKLQKYKNQDMKIYYEHGWAHYAIRKVGCYPYSDGDKKEKNIIIS
jgi:hypothetical protein